MDWREDRIGSAARSENPTVLAELQSGYAVIGDAQFLADVDLLATAVERACRATDPAFRRVNIDILGNADPFVHAHIWPRYEWEASELVWRPVWLYDLSNWRNPATALGEQHSPLRTRITKELRSLAHADVVRATVE